jgi:casein kinase II subunit beta
VFCPRCLDVYQPSIPNLNSVDGCAYGTTAPHLMFLVYPDLHADINEAWARMFSNVFDSNGIQLTGIYEPKMYGFRIHPSSDIGPKMQWLRKIRPPFTMDTSEQDE